MKSTHNIKDTVFHTDRSSHWRCFSKERCSLKWLFWKLAGEIFSQNSWKMPMKMFIFSKVADFQLATLLKMNFFIDIFQGFWPQISEHLFSRTPLSSSDSNINPVNPNVVFYVETTQFIYITDQLTGFYTNDYIWIGNVEAFMSIYHLWPSK